MYLVCSNDALIELHLKGLQGCLTAGLAKTKAFFIWSIFMRAVIDHMTFYDLNCPDIKF